MGNSFVTIVGLMILIGASMSAPQSLDLSGAPELGTTPTNSSSSQQPTLIGTQVNSSSNPVTNLQSQTQPDTGSTATQPVSIPNGNQSSPIPSPQGPPPEGGTIPSPSAPSNNLPASGTQLNPVPLTGEGNVSTVTAVQVQTPTLAPSANQSSGVNSLSTLPPATGVVNASAPASFVPTTVVPNNAGEPSKNETESPSRSPETTKTGNGTISDGSPSTTNQSEAEETRFDIQTQIYILSGTFGGILFLLVVLVLGLALALANLKTQLQSRQDKYGVTSSSSGDSPDHGGHPNKSSGSPERNNHHTSTINAYVNSAFNGGNSHEMEERRTEPRADLSRLGYEVYQGNRPNSQENNSRAWSQIPRARSKDDRVYTHALALDDSVAPRSTSPEKVEYLRSEGRKNRY